MPLSERLKPVAIDEFLLDMKDEFHSVILGLIPQNCGVKGLSLRFFQF